MQLLALLDGSRSRREIQADYLRSTGQQIREQDLEALLTELGDTGFLAGPAFERFYAARLAEYRAAPTRPLRDPNGYVIELTARTASHDRAMDPARNRARAILNEWQAGKPKEQGL